jgi:ubiquinone/menaquinone biosynthesis C-methylase UbiE
MDKNNKEIESITQFNKWAPTYEEGIWSGYFNSVYAEISRYANQYLRTNSVVLDIGCGTGKLEFLLSDKIRDGNITGVDISPLMIKEAEAKKIHKPTRNISFIISTANNLPFADNTFDIVFSLNALHHFPMHTSFFNEVRRVLKTNGTFILLDLIKDNFVRRIWIEIMKKMLNEKDVDFHTLEGIKKLAAGANLEVESQKIFWYFTAISVLKKTLTV